MILTNAWTGRQALARCRVRCERLSSAFVPPVTKVVQPQTLNPGCFDPSDSEVLVDHLQSAM